MVSDALFSSQTGEWETPQDLFDELDKEFHFRIDVCATSENSKCLLHYDKTINGLNMKWDAFTTGSYWMNPPYGRQIGDWLKKAAMSHDEYGSTIVCLLPARTDTKWFHNYVYGKAEIRFIKGRLKFGRSTNSAPFPSMVVIYGH